MLPVLTVLLISVILHIMWQLVIGQRMTKPRVIFTLFSCSRCSLSVVLTIEYSRLQVNQMFVFQLCLVCLVCHDGSPSYKSPSVVVHLPEIHPVDDQGVHLNVPHHIFKYREPPVNNMIICSTRGIEKKNRGKDNYNNKPLNQTKNWRFEHFWPN